MESDINSWPFNISLEALKKLFLSNLNEALDKSLTTYNLNISKTDHPNKTV